jgi:integrase
MTGSIATKTTAKGEVRYYAVFSEGVDPTTNRRKRVWSRPFDTEEEAHKERHAVERDMEEQTHVTPNRKVTVQSFLEAWIDGAQLRPSTVDSYRRNLKTHVLPSLGHFKLQSLSAQHLNGLYRKLEKSGCKDGSRLGEALSPRTVRYVHTIIRRALKDAVKQKLVVRNVALDADPPTAKMAKEAAPEMTVWSATELGRFLDFTKDDRYGPAWVFIATTGVRRGDALGLRWSDVNLDTSPATATIRRSTNAVGHRSEDGPTKTGRARLIELDAHSVVVLKAWKARQAEERLLVGPGYQAAEKRIFTLADGRGYHPERFSREFDRKQATFNRLRPDNPLPRITVHDLRHTWATLALAAGVHPKIVSERLGHSSIAITLDLYSHVMPGMQSQAAEQVSAMIFGA